MFHVVTVHWRSDAWIEPQLRFIERNMPEGTRVYASLSGIDRSWWDSFAYADDVAATHAENLNRLASVVSEQAAPDDHLVFMDGDAFPIAPIAAELLGGRPLAAVRRDENLGDPQPHPCFCLTTVGFWNEIGGDWSQGYTWTNALGYRTTDVGAELLRTLRQRGIEWRPLLRSNRVNVHPLWFAIYDDLVYHQGAGFRRSIARATLEMRPARAPSWLPVARRIDKQLATRAAMKRRRADADGREEERAAAQQILASIRDGGDFLAPLMATTRGHEPLEG